MGNALTYMNILEEIEEDELNQYYTDIAYQYGRLIRKVFDFDPISELFFAPIARSEPEDEDQITMGNSHTKFKNRHSQEMSDISIDIGEELLEYGVETVAKVKTAASLV